MFLFEMNGRCISENGFLKNTVEVQWKRVRTQRVIEFNSWNRDWRGHWWEKGCGSLHTKHTWETIHRYHYTGELTEGDPFHLPNEPFCGMGRTTKRALVISRMLIDLLIIALVIITADVQAEMNGKNKVDLEEIQLLDGNSSNTGVMLVGVEVIVKCFCSQHNTRQSGLSQTESVPTS